MPVFAPAMAGPENANFNSIALARTVTSRNVAPDRMRVPPPAAPPRLELITSHARAGVCGSCHASTNSGGARTNAAYRFHSAIARMPAAVTGFEIMTAPSRTAAPAASVLARWMCKPWAASRSGVCRIVSGSERRCASHTDGARAGGDRMGLRQKSVVRTGAMALSGVPDEGCPAGTPVLAAGAPADSARAAPARLRRGAGVTYVPR